MGNEGASLEGRLGATLAPPRWYSSVATRETRAEKRPGAGAILEDDMEWQIDDAMNGRR